MGACGQGAVQEREINSAGSVNETAAQTHEIKDIMKFPHALINKAD